MATTVLSPGAHHFQPSPLPKYVQANQVRVPEPQLGWLRPTSRDTPLEEMRQRLDQDDYLFVKGVIPREDVLQMREHYFSQYETTGLLKHDTLFVDGIYNSADDPSKHRSIGNPDGIFGDNEDLMKLQDAHTTPEYVDFVKHPALREFVRKLMGWDAEVLLQRTMLRHNVPGGESTGVHYDKLFLRAGSAFFLTAWVPLGDIKPIGGGLIYLKDSVKLGQAIEDDFMRRAEGFSPEEKISAFNVNMTKIGILNNNPIAFQEEHQHIAKRAGMGEREYKWLVANYEAGDVVFHHPCSIHSSCSNEDPEGIIRLSTDLRFYDKKDYDEGNADERWMRVWSPSDGL